MRRLPYAPTVPSPALWRDALRAWEVGVTAPQVIAMRYAQMAAAGSSPTRRDRDEYMRMGTEKLQAFGQAWGAMAMEAWLYPLKLATALARGTPLGSAAMPVPRLLGRSLAPVHRKVRANGKRLSRLHSRR